MDKPSCGQGVPSGVPPRLFRPVIVGAGIAGLTCAIALSAKFGIRSLILEKGSLQSLLDAGNGIQLPPNACNCMRSLGLLDKLIESAGGQAVASESLDYRDGSVLLHRDFSTFEEEYGAPWLSVTYSPSLRR